jgi:hypothetical protein
MEKDRSKKSYLYETTCTLYLLLDRIHSSFDRWSKELRNFRARIILQSKKSNSQELLTPSASADLDGYRHWGPYQEENQTEHIEVPSYHETDA